MSKYDDCLDEGCTVIGAFCGDVCILLIKIIFTPILTPIALVGFLSSKRRDSKT